MHNFCVLLDQLNSFVMKNRLFMTPASTSALREGSAKCEGFFDQDEKLLRQ